MIFQQILLEILHKLQHERTISSAFHLLRGKRSGQTIQDVGIFKLHSYFSIMPKLKRSHFDESCKELIERGVITLYDDGFYTIHEANQMDQPVLFFDGWRLRGNEHIFFSRLSILIETLSHLKSDVAYFAPTEKNVETINFIRSYLKNVPYKEASYREEMYKELSELIARARMTNEQRDILVARLTGHQLPGYTWAQLARHFNETVETIHLYYISALHAILDELDEEAFPRLYPLTTNVYIEMPLTSSTYETVKLLKQGKTLQQVAQIRQLKESTIEDHLVEIAMNIPSFSIATYLSDQQVEEILTASEQLQTKKLRMLKQQLPDYSYFQIRLALAKGGTV